MAAPFPSLPLYLILLIFISTIFQCCIAQTPSTETKIICDRCIDSRHLNYLRDCYRLQEYVRSNSLLDLLMHLKGSYNALSYALSPITDATCQNHFKTILNHSKYILKEKVIRNWYAKSYFLQELLARTDDPPPSQLLPTSGFPLPPGSINMTLLTARPRRIFQISFAFFDPGEEGVTKFFNAFFSSYGNNDSYVLQGKKSISVIGDSMYRVAVDRPAL